MCVCVSVWARATLCKRDKDVCSTFGNASMISFHFFLFARSFIWLGSPVCVKKFVHIGLVFLYSSHSTHIILDYFRWIYIFLSKSISLQIVVSCARVFYFLYSILFVKLISCFKYVWFSLFLFTCLGVCVCTWITFGTINFNVIHQWKPATYECVVAYYVV